jgi:hypothetical protein
MIPLSPQLAPARLTRARCARPAAPRPQITQCDGILEHMEQLLGKFQSDLGKVSDEIRALQVQSQAMSTRLKNRRTIENRLGAFIEAMAVPEEMVAGIMDAEVGRGRGRGRRRGVQEAVALVVF